MAGKKISTRQLWKKLEILYDQYNTRAYVDPDPLLFLYQYKDPRDREIAGMVASALAYGRVAMIMKIVASVLETMGSSPYRFVADRDPGRIKSKFNGFKYRFATQDHICSLLKGLGAVVRTHGSLERCFLAGNARKDVQTGLTTLFREISRQGDVGHLMADPGKTSACKRSHLFLRWMVRQDRVDPGGWQGVPARALVCPVDTHMYRIGSFLGFTRRKSPDKKCALEITQGFAEVEAGDPVKYDFALTRFGIRRQFEIKDLAQFIYS